MTPEQHKFIIRIEAGIILLLLLISSLAVYRWQRSEDNYLSIKDYNHSLQDTLRHLKNNVVEKPIVEVTQTAFDELAKENIGLKKELSLEKIKSKNVKSFTEIVSGVDMKKPIVIRLTPTLSEGEGAATSSQPSPHGEGGTQSVKNDTMRFDVDSNYYSIHGKVLKNRVELDSINFPDSLSIISSVRNHLFARDEYNLSARHSNPLIKTKGILNLTVKEERKWWDRRGYFIGAGILSGYLLFRR